MREALASILSLIEEKIKLKLIGFDQIKQASQNKRVSRKFTIIKKFTVRLVSDREYRH